MTRARFMLVALLAAALMITAATPSLAVELPRNSVNSKQIKNKQVKTTDLAKGAVKRPDIAVGAVDGTNILDGALSGYDIANNSLRGSEIDEATLDTGASARVTIGESTDATNCRFVVEAVTSS